MNKEQLKDAISKRFAKSRSRENYYMRLDTCVYVNEPLVIKILTDIFRDEKESDIRDVVDKLDFASKSQLKELNENLIIWKFFKNHFKNKYTLRFEVNHLVNSYCKKFGFISEMTVLRNLNEYFVENKIAYQIETISINKYIVVG